MHSPAGSPRSKHTLASFIFLSRWLQAPLYLGLILAQAIYVYRFLLELFHLIEFALFNHAPPASTPKASWTPKRSSCSASWDSSTSS
jgi:Uncharacterized protein family, UPF0114